MGAAANEILIIDCESSELEEGIIASARATLQSNVGESSKGNSKR